MLHLCAYGYLLTRPLQKGGEHRKRHVRLSKVTWVNFTATRYSVLDSIPEADLEGELPRRGVW